MASVPPRYFLTVSDLLPILRDLSRADKLRVVQSLVTEIAEQENVPAIPPGTYPIWSPYDVADAAGALMAALAEDEMSCQPITIRSPIVAALKR